MTKILPLLGAAIVAMVVLSLFGKPSQRRQRRASLLDRLDYLDGRDDGIEVDYDLSDGDGGGDGGGD
jgi:hypothetical protein